MSAVVIERLKDMIHRKRNGQGFIASATLECIGAMLAHHQATTITPARQAAEAAFKRPMPPVKVKGCSLPFEETLAQYWLATRHRKMKRGLFA